MDQRQFLLGLANYFENIGKLIQLEAQPSEVLRPVCMELNPVTMTIRHHGSVSEPLTAKEFQIATFLNSVANKDVTRKDILKTVWGSVRVNAKTINVHIFNLRRKLGPLGIKIVFLEPDSYRLICGEVECDAVSA